MKPVVAIVGRPNVGKSTLFNRLVGRPIAIVSDVPGTTRDRLFADVTWEEREVTLVDTGGLEPVPSSAMARKVAEQVDIAIAEADVLLLVLDVGEGLLPADFEITERLRRSGKPVVVVANKADSEKQEALAGDFHRLGIGDVVPVSAYHGRGIAGLREAVLPRLPESTDAAEPSPPDAVKIAIVGRPGVGKSTLVNAILRTPRAIVNDVPGTTRDAVDTLVHHGDRDILLIDTGGIRQRGRIGAGLDYYSLIRALRAIQRCDVALLVTDASQSVTAQDTHVAQYVIEARKGVLVIVNKSDLIPDGDREEHRRQVEEALNFMSWAPVLYTCGTMGKGVGRILPLATRIWEERSRYLPPDAVGDIIGDAVASHPPPRRGLEKLTVRGGRQVGVNPPTFEVLVNEPRLVHFSYRRYLENRLRQAFGFSGTPVSMIFKRSKKRGIGARRA